MEMVKWIGNFTLLLKRVKDSWMDMLPLNSMSETTIEAQYRADVTPDNAQRQNRGQDLLQENREEWNAVQVAIHVGRFTFSDNLTTLMLIVASDLSDVQGERLTSSLSLQE